MKQGDVVLIWGATGGIGAYADAVRVERRRHPGVRRVQRVDKAADPARPRRRGDHRSACRRLPVLGRTTTQDESEWRRLGKDIRGLVGEDPDIVFEHPGRSTFGASMYVVKRGGTVVTCAATSGFMMEFDNRHFWMRLKRLDRQPLRQLPEA